MAKIDTPPMMTEAEIAELEAKLEAVKKQAEIDAKKKIAGIDAEKEKEKEAGVAELDAIKNISSKCYARADLQSALTGLKGKERKIKRAELIAKNRTGQIKALQTANLAVESGILDVFTKKVTNKSGEVIGFNACYRKTAGLHNIENVRLVVPAKALALLM